MASFRTAYLQAMLPLDCVVVGAVPEGTKITSANRKTAIMRGDFVVLTPATANIPAFIKKATAEEVTNGEATHIIALTDQTIGGGYIPTDVLDYAPSDLVGATSEADPADNTAVIKKVGLWPIWDWADIIPDKDENDRLA